jgi:hypothetical protein
VGGWGVCVCVWGGGGRARTYLIDSDELSGAEDGNRLVGRLVKVGPNKQRGGEEAPEREVASGLLVSDAYISHLVERNIRDEVCGSVTPNYT